MCKTLRDLIAKRGEKSPPKFLADFLFSTPFKTTYPCVLEIILSLALEPKPGAEKGYLTFRPENSDFDHFDKMLSGSLGLRDGKST